MMSSLRERLWACGESKLFLGVLIVVKTMRFQSGSSKWELFCYLLLCVVSVCVQALFI